MDTPRHWYVGPHNDDGSHWLFVGLHTEREIAGTFTHLVTRAKDQGFAKHYLPAGDCNQSHCSCGGKGATQQSTWIENPPGASVRNRSKLLLLEQSK